MGTLTRSAVWLALGACVAFAGCNRSSSSSSSDEAADKAGAGEAGEGNEETTPRSKDEAKGGKRPARPPGVKEADARALLDRWLEVQNKGEFEAYESLYAKRFEGVRRSGPKVVRLDRDGWMKERGRMFKRKMEVELSDIEVDVFAQSAVLTFTQRWASGKYEDVGPKQLVLTREGEDLRIAREEMLASTLIEGGQQTALADGSFVFLIEEGGTSYAVLDALGHDATVEGYTLIDDGEPVVVEAKLAAADVPVAVDRWRGQKLDMGGCNATIGDIVALSRVVPHFGERQVWEGTFEENEPYTRDEIAAAGFHHSAAYFAGKLVYDEGCGGGMYGFAAGAKGPVEDTLAIEPDRAAALAAAAVEAFRKLPAYEALQKDHEGYGQSGPWVENEGGQGPVVHTTLRPDGKVQVVVTARAGRGCGDFEGALTAHYLATGSGPRPKLKLVHTGEYSREIVEALDVDRDGTFEYITQTFTDIELVSWSGETLRAISIGFFDCGC